MTKITLPLVYTARCSQMCVEDVESKCGTKVQVVVEMLMYIDAAICVLIIGWAGYVAFELHKGMKNNFFFECLLVFSFYKQTKPKNTWTLAAGSNNVFR